MSRKLIVLILCAFLCGCAAKTDFAGTTYMATSLNGNEIPEVSSEVGFKIEFIDEEKVWMGILGEMESEGTYAVDGSTITLTFEGNGVYPASTEELRIEGNKLIAEDGNQTVEFTKK